MKKSFRILTLLLSLLLLCSLLVACSDPAQTDKPSEDDWQPKGEQITILKKGELTNYICVFDDTDEVAKNGAMAFKDSLVANGVSCSQTILSDAGEEYPNEILFGNTSRKASGIAVEYLESKMGGESTDFHWVIYYRDGKLCVVANNEHAYEEAARYLYKQYFTGDAIVVPDSLKDYGTRPLSEYEEEVAKKRKEEAEKFKKNYLDVLTEKLEENPDFSGATKNILNLVAGNPWGTPTNNPISEHPRLMLTKDDLPGIRKALLEDTATNKLFREYIESDEEGILPKVTGTHNPSSPKNLSNFNQTVLEKINCLALAHLVYEDDLYGYRAIYVLKNFLNTLDIQYITGDQYRQFGDIAYTTALVYDWCYDLLSDEDKEQIISATEKKVFDGSNLKGVRFEIGFPPTLQGSFTGHGSEYQLLRDYLSFSIAIYDENPSWYQYVGARFYNDYVVSRNYYFESTGIASQGTNYLSLRHTATLYSAWIITKATGENPYKGLENTMTSFFSYEYKPGYIFRDGDGEVTPSNSRFRDAAFLAAYLYNDATALAQAESILGDSALTHNVQGLGTATYIVLRGSGLEPAESRFEGLPLIQYNGGILGQYVTREAWGVEDSATVFMKMKERNTANHEHGDAGTFQIYYKGLLTSDAGVYDNYNSPHTQNFHKKTIAHNGLLIYNNAYANEMWYSGSQKYVGESSTLNAWLNNSIADIGKITGHQHGYTDASESTPLYAYVAGDITKAYDASTVNYVGRRMLVVYTGNDEFPMAFFVYDDIESDKAAFVKSFLLQITSSEKPDVDTKNQTVTTENGGGRLVLTCLSSGVDIELYGGRSYKAGRYDAANSKNYLINGKQLASPNGQDDGHWGRVEIVDYGKTTTTFMNVLYVTDKGNKNDATVEKLTDTVGVEGGEWNEQIVALFASSRERATETLEATVSGKGDRSYYISGVAAGKWSVTVDGKSVDSFSATEEGGLLTFTAPAGKVVISPVK